MQKKQNTEVQVIDQETLKPNKRALKQKDILHNNKLEEKILANPNKMPVAVYYILPNEMAERFCFYGISPLLNEFFAVYLNLGKKVAVEMVHIFKFASYFTPLLGAAISDSFLGKYETIVILSFVYLIGTALLSTFAHPDLTNEAGAIVGLLLVAIGTGGIKPCVGILY